MKNRILFLFLLTGAIAGAQVPVSREPRHHVVFENSKARVLNVLLPVGDTTMYHVHSTPSVFIGLSTTHTGSQLLHEQPTDGTFTAGNAFFENLAAPHIRTHRVWNLDTSVFHVMDIELLAEKPGFVLKPFSAKFIRLETDTSWVRTYKIELLKNEKATVHEKQRTFILVSWKYQKVNLAINKKDIASFLSAGDFFWLKPGDQFTIMNPADSQASLLLIEVI